MAKKYLIDQEQFDDISHYKRMFELNAEYIQGLCSSEKDDIVYGYELGKMYTHLRQCFVDMMDLECKIKEQQVKDE